VSVQAKSFHDELQDTLQQLSEIDAQLVTSQPVGGLPETARKQLEQLQVSNVWFCPEKILSFRLQSYCFMQYDLLLA